MLWKWRLFQSVSFGWRNKDTLKLLPKISRERFNWGGQEGIRIHSRDRNWKPPGLKADLDTTVVVSLLFFFFFSFFFALSPSPIPSFLNLYSLSVLFLSSFSLHMVHGILSQSDFAANWLSVLVSPCQVSKKGIWLAQIIILS